MIDCHPIPTDTPGIFRCPVCGLQNPRPIAKPFIAVCGKATPPEPRIEADIDYILDVLCPGCVHSKGGECTYLAGKCGKIQRPVEELARNPLSQCPIWRW